jgi:hypothetical protein
LVVIDWTGLPYTLCVQDGVLSEEEVFKHYNKFATSRVTRYGRMLKEEELLPEENETPEKKTKIDEKQNNEKKDENKENKPEEKKNENRKPVDEL